MPQYGYLVVEGPHDVAFVGRLLRPFGLRRVRLISDLDPFWTDLVPGTFPHSGDLLKRVPVPTFFADETHSVAVDSAIGDSRIAQTVQESLVYISTVQLTGIGLILDADAQDSPSDRFRSVKDRLAQLGVSLALPDAPGQILKGAPRSGMFILPDNAAAGTLEDLLLECAALAYPQLLQGAKAFVRDVDVAVLTREDRREFERPAGRDKAIVNSIGSVLKPGKSIQVSIQDNRWVGEHALSIARIQAMQTFLAELLELDRHTLES